MAGYRIEVRKLNTAGTIIITYQLPVFDNFNFSINTPVTPTPLPEEDSEEQILIKVEGNSTTVNLTWKIINHTTDQLTGSGITGNTRTIWEQMLALKNTFRPVSIDDAFTLAVVDTSNSTDVISWDGTINSIVCSLTSGTGAPSISGYRIQYRKNYTFDDWTTVDYTGSATSKVLGGLTAAQSYILRVSMTNSNGVSGDHSKAIVQTSGA